jgi:hypothetical protein
MKEAGVEFVPRPLFSAHNSENPTRSINVSNGGKPATVKHRTDGRGRVQLPVRFFEK